MPDFDLLITGGTVVSPRGRRRGDVAVIGGRIVVVGKAGDGAGLSARESLDASGLLLLPGGVDTHVHLMDPGSTDREDFPHGTRAAAAAGTTTIIEHAHGNPVRTTGDLRAKVDYLRGRSNVDFGLAAHAWPGRSHEVHALWAAGAAFFKLFTCTTHGVPGHTAAALQQHLNLTADVDAMSVIHCEDESITEAAEELLRAEGREDGGIIPQWRNRDAEVVAAAVTALLVRRTGARAAVAHVSHPEVAKYVSHERRRGARLAAETCPQYLLLREDEVLDRGAFRKFTPRARARHDADESAMWRLLREGHLTHVSSDHAPATAPQKTARGIWDVHFGLPGLDSTMALLIDAAARQMIAYEDIARLYAETPARLYGLWPHKGAIAPGFDADIAVVDPAGTRTLQNEKVLSKAGWTPFDGRRISGRVERTYLRGQVVADDGQATDARTGQFLPGAGYRG
jgi:dihydroorotase (multifunctional complex type)